MSQRARRHSGQQQTSVRTSLHILWENGKTTWEPFTTHDKMGIFDQDPVMVALYAVKHNLIGQPGWSDPLLRKYAKTP
jgi:hypothetical protein